MVRMDENMPFLLQYENVAWYENGKVRILDRRIYPTEVRFVECVTYQEVVQAIADMVTQSAGPYTAVGMGMALAAWQIRDKGAAEQNAFLKQAAYDLAHARPTTANRYGQITYRCAEVAQAVEDSLVLSAIYGYLILAITVAGCVILWRHRKRIHLREGASPIPVEEKRGLFLGNSGMIAMMVLSGILMLYVAFLA
mgnify:CR=1 FL=1